MAEVAIGALQWQRATSNSPDLVAPYACDFTAASSFRFSPKGTVAATPTMVTGAEGMVVDNMLNGVPLQVACGPIIEVCPAFQKTYIRLDPLSSPDVVIAASSGMARVYFFTGAFHGNTQNVNTYAAYKAGVVTTNTDGTQDVYFNTVRWKSDALLANGFNLDNLTDSGFYDVLNPVSPASGNLPAGTWQITSLVYSSSPLYCYQQARNILSPDTQVFERRQLSGFGWSPWRNTGLNVTGQCQAQFVASTYCKLMPFNGGLISINGNLETIPFNNGSGITCPNTIGAAQLAGSTLYYGYVYMAAGAMQFEWSTTPFARDARGVPIKAGDATRTHVMIAFTDGNGQFQDNDVFRYFVSYFNRPRRTFNKATAQSPGTASSNFVGLTGDLNAYILTYDDDIVSSEFTAWGGCTNAGSFMQTRLMVGATPGGVTTLQSTVAGTIIATNNIKPGIGQFTIAPQGNCQNGGSASWYGGQVAGIIT